MNDYFKSLFTSKDDQDPGFIRLVRVVLALSTVATFIIAIVLALTIKRDTLWVSVGIIFIIAILSGISLFLSYRDILWPGKALLPLTILVGVTFLAINANGLHDSAIVGFSFVIIITSLITGKKAIPLATFITLLGVWTVAYADISGITQSTMAERTAVDDIVVISVIQIIVAASLNGLMSRLNSALEASRSNEQILEQRVAERTKALSSVAEVSAAASTILETDRLLQRVVDLAKERFGFYHAHIYLLNDTGDTLVLSSGAGEVGQQMVVKGRSIPLDSEQSLVARAAREKKGVTVNDVTTEPNFLPNPLLPDTHSELAVPMMVGDTVLGVFDVQSDVVGRFTESDIAVQTTLASQVASAVQNARLYSDTLEAQKLTRNVIDSTDDWIFIKDQNHRYQLVNQGYANSLHIPISDFIGKNDLELGFPEELVKGNPEKGIRGFWADDRAVMDGGVTKQIPDDLVTIDGNIHVFDTVKVPLRDANNKVWGVLAFARDMTERRRLEELMTQRARQQEAINQITQRIQGTTSIEAALQMAVRELGRSVGKEIHVMLDSSVKNDGRDN